MSSSRSQNGWTAIGPDRQDLLHTWVVPARNGTFHLRLRRSPAGFVLAHFALWMSENVEDATLPGVPDDWGYAFRAVRGYSTTLSNHASGTAMDLNATRHPLGKSGTFAAKQVRAIRGRLAWATYRHTLRWGGDYHGRKDEMHVEVVARRTVVQAVARALTKTPRGKRLLAANPDQRGRLT